MQDFNQIFSPKKKFLLLDARRKHISRHFHNSNLAGSIFLPSPFTRADDLVDYLNSNSAAFPLQETRSKQTICFTFMYHENIGTEGISLRSALPEASILKETRDGYCVDVAEVIELKATRFFCVIAKEHAEHFSIITAFPGSYARPFAQKGQPADEYAMNKKFWEEHVLLKRIKTQL